MKQVLVISLSLTIIMIGAGLVNISAVNDQVYDTQITDRSIELTQTTDELSKPMLVNITGNSITLRERNETIGLGGIFKADLNQNVTIMYKIMNGLNETDLRLYADVPGNYSLTNSSQTLSFSNVTTVIEDFYDIDAQINFPNASVTYYNVEFNVSNPIIPFFAMYDTVSEGDNDAPHNLLTTKRNWAISTEDDFFIQQENVTVSLVANDTDALDTYGLRYKEDLSAFTNENFTTTPDGNNETGSINLGKFEPGTTLTFESYVYVFEGNATVNETRMISRIDHLIIEVGDGTPLIAINPFNTIEPGRLVNTTFYTQNGTVTLNYSASVPKGNITRFSFISDALTSVLNITATTNASLLGEVMNSTFVFSPGKTNITIIAETNKGLFANTTYLIVVDRTVPTLSLSAGNSTGNLAITTTSGKVTFNFLSDDDNSGVRYMVLDLGDGVKVEVTDMESYTHTYTEFTGTSTFEVTLTVMDNAGNVESKGVLVTLTYDDGLELTSVNSVVPTLIFVLIVAIIYFLPRIIDFVRDKLGR